MDDNRTAEEVFGPPVIGPKPRNLYAEHLDAIESEYAARPICQGCQRVFQSDAEGRTYIAVTFAGVRGLWHWRCYQQNQRTVAR